MSDDHFKARADRPFTDDEIREAASASLDERRTRDRERRAGEVLEFLGVEPVPDDYQPESDSPIEGLRYSERKLWNECPEAHDVLARLSRERARMKRTERELRMTRIAAGNFFTAVHARALKLDDTRLMKMADDFLARISQDDG